MTVTIRRSPDGVDAARLLATLLAASVGVWLLAVATRSPAAGALQQMLFLAIPLVYARRAGLGASEGNAFRRPTLLALGLVVLGSLSTLWLIKGVSEIQVEVFRLVGALEEARRQEQHLRRGIENVMRLGVPAGVLLLAVVPPICEETMFRGAMLRGLASRFGWPFAVAASAVLFALMHQTLTQGVLMILLGTWFGFLARATGSLWCPILAHALNNLAVVTLVRLYGDRLESMSPPGWMYVLSAVVFGLVVALLSMEAGKESSPPRA